MNIRMRLAAHNLLRLAALAAAFTLAGVSGAGAAELHPGVTVTASTVTLGDLFDEAGDAARVVVADAPAPGMTSEISVSRISLIARRNGLVWRNNGGLSHVTVARSGVALPEATISSALAAAIQNQTPSLSPAAKLQVDYANGASGVQVGMGEAQTVKVEQLAFNPRTGAFSAFLRAPANNMLSPLHRVSGRAYPVLDVPVLAREIAPGDIVRAQDIDWIRLPADRVSQNIITASSQLVGMSPRHPVRTGEPLRQMDMQPPIVVAKGAQVDVTFVSGALRLTARGRALQSGAVGDAVDVLNTRSNRTIQGIVQGPNMVRIGAPGDTADLKS